MSNGPASEDGRRHPWDSLDGGPDPDQRVVLSDGSGGTLVEPAGDEPGGRVVAERDVDEVFEQFEEDTPEEVIEASDRPDDRKPMVEGDIDGLFADLSTATDEDGGLRPAALSGSVSERVVDDVLATVRDREADDLFEERGGHKHVVADSDVDDVFERFVEDEPEEVMEARDPALASPTEDELRSLGESDDPLGELPDPPEDAPGAGGVGASGRETPDALERTGEDTHRSVGKADVDAVFEEFEEGSVEDVINAGRVDPEDDEMVQTGVDETVDPLFGDFSGIDLEPRPVPDADDEGPGPAPAPEETADAIEGLLEDLSAADVPSPGELTSPEETADAIEGLLDDLSTVEDAAEAGTAMTGDPPTGDGRDEPADIERIRAEVRGDDGVATGVEVNRAPADDVVDVSATALYCAFDGEGPVDVPDDLAVGGGWSETGAPPADGVTASTTFAALRERVDQVPTSSVPETTGDRTVDVPDIDLEQSGSGEDASTAREAGAVGPDHRATTTDGDTGMAKTDETTVPPTDAETTGEGATPTEDVEELFADYEGDTPEDVVANSTGAERDEPDDAIVGDVEGLFADLSAVEVRPVEDDPDRSTPSTDRAPDSDAAVREVEEILSDLKSVEVDPTPVESDREPTGSYDIDLEPATVETGGSADVDAVFEEFEEETIDEVIEADADPATPPTVGEEDDDEPAEVETGDFMMKLAAGMDPEEIGIAVYDGSQTDGDDGEGGAIADSSAVEAESTPDDGRPSIEDPTTSTGDGSPSFEEPSAGADSSGSASGDDGRPAAPETVASRSLGADRRTAGERPSAETDRRPSGDGAREQDDGDRFRASNSGPGSETLFPAESVGESDDGDDEGDPAEGTVREAFVLLVDRIRARIRELF